MDWDGIIERNTGALRRILAALVAMAGLNSRGQSTIFPQTGALPQDKAPAEKSKLSPAPTLPRRLHRAVLRLLRPAESAARRLVIVAARDIVVEFSPPRPRKPKPNPKSAFIRRPGGAGILMTRGLRNQADAARAAPRTLRLPLFDALRRPDRIRRPVRNSVPRISFPGLIEPSPIKLRRPPAPWDPIDATRLALRLAALGRALDDLPGHAKRFARWRTRKAAAMQDQETSRREGGRMRFPRLFPLRFGRPPGQRSRNSRLPEHEVHDVLADLQYFAHQAFPDTS